MHEVFSTINIGPEFRLVSNQMLAEQLSIWAGWNQKWCLYSVFGQRFRRFCWWLYCRWLEQWWIAPTKASIKDDSHRCRENQPSGRLFIRILSYGCAYFVLAKCRTCVEHPFDKKSSPKHREEGIVLLSVAVVKIAGINLWWTRAKTKRPLNQEKKNRQRSRKKKILDGKNALCHPSKMREKRMNESN